VSVSGAPHSSVLAVTKGLQELGFLDPTRHFIHARLTERGREPIETTLLFSRFREIRLPTPRITWQARKVGDKAFEVEIQSKSFAKAVSVETQMATAYSDNFVDIVPGSKKTILVKVRREAELDKFLEGLKVGGGISR
jgi:hypothetical protein